MVIDVSLLRLLWAVIEEESTQKLLSASDTALIAMLLQQVSHRVLLTGETSAQLYSYLASKLTLIRDMADERQIRILNLAAHEQSCVSKFEQAS